MKNLKIYISLLFTLVVSTIFAQVEGVAYTCKIAAANPNLMSEFNERRPGECMWVIASDYTIWKYNGSLTLGSRWEAVLVSETDPTAWKRSGIVATGSDFIGTNNGEALRFRVNTVPVGEFATDGKFLIGTTPATHALTVNNGDAAVYGTFSPRIILGKTLTTGEYGQLQFNGDFNIFRLGHSNSIVNSGIYNFNAHSNNKITFNGDTQYGDVSINSLSNGKTIPNNGSTDGDFVIGTLNGLSRMALGMNPSGDSYIQALYTNNTSAQSLILQRHGGPVMIGKETNNDSDAKLHVGKAASGLLGGYAMFTNDAPTAAGNQAGIGFKIGSEFVSGFTSAQILAEATGNGFDTDLLFRTYNGSPVNIGRFKANGRFLLNNMAGTGDRLAITNSLGELVPSSIDPATIATTSTALVGDVTGTLGATEIAASAVGSAEIANGSIALGDMAPSSVNSNIIVNGSVGPLDLNAGTAAIGDVLMFEGAGVGMIPNSSGGDVSGAYNNLQLGTSVVTATELASNSVNSAKIVNGAVQFEDWSTNGATVTGQKIVYDAATGWGLNSGEFTPITTTAGATHQVIINDANIYANDATGTTTINLPEIVTGVLSVNQVNPGQVYEVVIERSVIVTINAVGADQIKAHNQVGFSTSITTTANTFYYQKFKAVAPNLWAVTPQ